MWTAEELQIKEFLHKLHNAFMRDIERAVANGDSRLKTTHVREYLADNNGMRVALLKYADTHDIDRDIWTNIMDGIRPNIENSDWFAMTVRIIQQKETDHNEMDQKTKKGLYETLPQVCEAMYTHFYDMVLGPTTSRFETINFMKQDLGFRVPSHRPDYTQRDFLPLYMEMKCGRCGNLVKLDPLQ
jgi:hypothetical protein